MSYATYTTEAIVCGSYDHNSADRSFLLFTKEAGMVYAIAKSVRNEASKQRYALQDFSLIRVSLIKGKSGWRIGSTEPIENPFQASDKRPQRAAVLRVITALRQFLQGEDSEEEIYHDAKTILQHLIKEQDEISPEIVDLFILRMLYRLGYIAKDPEFAEFLENGDWHLLDKPLPSQAHKAIKEAYKVSHLD